MNKIILVFALLVLALGESSMSQDIPTAATFRKWAGFPNDFTLEANKKAKVDKKWGEPIWACSFQNRKRSLVSYYVAVFKPGTMWGKERGKMPAYVEEQVSKKIDGLEEFFKIGKNSEGGKSYFTVLGFGPGGTISGGFTFHSRYDLIVSKAIDHEDDATTRMIDPVTPSKDLYEIFTSVEKFISETTKANKAALPTPLPAGVSSDDL